MSQAEISEQPELFGHPTGLYTLFFAEMWERFSYYGMRALLIFYMIKGFLGYGDGQAYTVYGAYTALVYMTPFIGGLLADKILGKRIAVVIGGLLMAGGHLLMTVESEWPFFFALALLITGNGFFKPNISTTVGSLYKDGDKRRDDGFNIFYTGINLGAAISPLLCGYVGETYGWHYGFGLATIGMLIGLAVFVMPNLITSFLIFAGALASAIGMLYFRPDNFWAISINVFVAACLMISAVIACMALSRGGLPKWAGGRPDGMDSRHDWKIYVGIAISIPVFALLVSGFSPFSPPPVDELTGEPVPVKTNEERMADQIEFVEKFGVKKEIVDAVKSTPIEGELKQRGKPYTLISEDVINDVKGVSDKRVNKLLMQQLLADQGKDLPDTSTFVDIAKAAKAAGIEVDKADITDLSPERKGQLISALETEFGFAFSDEEKSGFTNRKALIETVNSRRSSFAGAMAGIFLEEVSKPAGLVLTILGLLAFGYLIKETFRLPKIQRERMIAALILIFFQMLFFAFFEQAGSSVNNFTDRNIDRVAEDSNVTADMVGKTIQIQPTQAQLGYERNGSVFTLDDLEAIKKIEQNHPDLGPVEIPWTVTESNAGMGIAQRLDELPATIFQSFNAIFILIFALIFNWIWATLRKRGWDPNAAIKFGLGLIQLGMGFGAFWLGAQNCDAIGMVAISWLTLGILLQTTGELCLSPVGLSTMTKLSPKHLVSTLMGAWFLATAFSQYLAGVISQFTSVSSVEGFPPPSETVNVYGEVFKSIAITAMLCGLVCIIISPILNKWMHTDKFDDDLKEKPEK
ncbi:MAG: peptide MFS transporter [Mariniblastus sp.]